MSHPLQERIQCRVRTEWSPALVRDLQRDPGFRQGHGPTHFGPHILERRCHQACRRAPLAGKLTFRSEAGLNHQAARCDHGGQFRITELLQQAKDVAVDRFLPDVLTHIEIAAHAHGINACVQSTGIQRQ